MAGYYACGAFIVNTISGFCANNMQFSITNVFMINKSKKKKNILNILLFLHTFLSKARKLLNYLFFFFFFYCILILQLFFFICDDILLFLKNI